jgi:hypothetical protein
VELRCEQAYCDALQLGKGDHAPLWLRENDVGVARPASEAVDGECDVRVGDSDLKIRMQIG